MRVPIHIVRVLGYIMAATVAVAYFMVDLPEAWTHSLFLQFSPVWLSCGWLLTLYKKKSFPFSRAENIFCTVFGLSVAALLALRLLLVLFAK